MEWKEVEGLLIRWLVIGRWRSIVYHYAQVPGAQVVLRIKDVADTQLS